MAILWWLEYHEPPPHQTIKGNKVLACYTHPKFGEANGTWYCEIGIINKDITKVCIDETNVEEIFIKVGGCI